MAPNSILLTDRQLMRLTRECWSSKSKALSSCKLSKCMHAYVLNIQLQIICVKIWTSVIGGKHLLVWHSTFQLTLCKRCIDYLLTLFLFLLISVLIQVDVEEVMYIAKELWHGRSARDQSKKDVGRGMWRSVNELMLVRYENLWTYAV